MEGPSTPEEIVMAWQRLEGLDPEFDVGLLPRGICGCIVMASDNRLVGEHSIMRRRPRRSAGCKWPVLSIKCREKTAMNRDERSYQWAEAYTREIATRGQAPLPSGAASHGALGGSTNGAGLKRDRSESPEESSEHEMRAIIKRMETSCCLQDPQEVQAALRVVANEPTGNSRFAEVLDVLLQWAMGGHQDRLERIKQLDEDKRKPAKRRKPDETPTVVTQAFQEHWGAVLSACSQVCHASRRVVLSNRRYRQLLRSYLVQKGVSRVLPNEGLEWRPLLSMEALKLMTSEYGLQHATHLALSALRSVLEAHLMEVVQIARLLCLHRHKAPPVKDMVALKGRLLASSRSPSAPSYCGETEAVVISDDLRMALLLLRGPGEEADKPAADEHRRSGKSEANMRASLVPSLLRLVRAAGVVEFEVAGVVDVMCSEAQRVVREVVTAVRHLPPCPSFFEEEEEEVEGGDGTSAMDDDSLGSLAWVVKRLALRAIEAVDCHSIALFDTWQHRPGSSAASSPPLAPSFVPYMICALHGGLLGEVEEAVGIIEAMDLPFRQAVNAYVQELFHMTSLIQCYRRHTTMVAGETLWSGPCDLLSGERVVSVSELDCAQIKRGDIDLASLILNWRGCRGRPPACRQRVRMSGIVPDSDIVLWLYKLASRAGIHWIQLSSPLIFASIWAELVQAAERAAAHAGSLYLTLGPRASHEPESSVSSSCCTTRSSEGRGFMWPFIKSALKPDSLPDSEEYDDLEVSSSDKGVEDLPQWQSENEGYMNQSGTASSGEVGSGVDRPEKPAGWCGVREIGRALRSLPPLTLACGSRLYGEGMMWSCSLPFGPPKINDGAEDDEDGIGGSVLGEEEEECMMAH